MRSDTSMRMIAGVLAGLSILVCLGAAVAVFKGAVTTETFKWTFLTASLVWFVGATAWTTLRKKA